MYATSNVSQYLPCHAFQSDLAQVFNQTDSHRDDLDLLQTPNQRMTESRLPRQCYYWPKFSHSSDDSIAPLFVICQNLFKFIKKIHIRLAHLVKLLIKTSLISSWHWHWLRCQWSWPLQCGSQGLTRPAVSEDELMAITIIGYNWSHNGGNYDGNCCQLWWWWQ